MNAEEDPYLDEIVCPCSGTRRAQILVVLNRGDCSLDAVSRATGACSGCGGCEYDVERIINQHLQQS
jgi:NAD(P)H-nitrite reductase large subunit